MSLGGAIYHAPVLICQFSFGSRETFFLFLSYAHLYGGGKFAFLRYRRGICDTWAIIEFGFITATALFIERWTEM